MKIIFTPILIALCLLTMSAKASVYTGLNLFYWTNDVNDGTTDTKTTYTFPALAVGWVSTKSLYLGLTYSPWSKTTAGASTTTTSYTDYGPTIGYMATNWHVFGTYLFSCTYNLATTSTTTDTGAGMSVELGYHWASGSFTVGPSLIYITRTYTNQTAPTSQGLAKNMTIVDMIPLFTFGYHFN